MGSNLELCRHDEILVVGQLIAWAQETGNQQIASLDFQLTISQLLNERKLEKAIGLTWTYLILRKKHGKELPIDLDWLQGQLSEAIQNQGEEVAARESLRNLILRVADRLPKLRNDLGLGARNEG